MDSGIRRGADVIKALALGANAVLLGRPYVYALAVAGQAGVERVVRNLTAEIDLTLALAGGRDVKAFERSWVTQRACEATSSEVIAGRCQSTRWGAGSTYSTARV